MPGDPSREEPDARRVVELFTHPICSGCQQAYDALRKLEHDGRITLSVCSLGTTPGRRRAEQLHVSSVPTVRLGGDFRVLLGKSDLATLIAELDGAVD